ncbi:DUF4913 domain-containing protein [Dietzia sp. SL131]|uniref:DUF4913 domain-containing protein n=1 Tax=Dietzia sp. SL131 TaxID=2995149 RepID=UPI00227CCEED|nr:DUF4913 domain-containing protein [Dietzia sp. SL131]MCY1655693.1 DUF4913 domain-containing protein [Dietzia sp. SL131]
MRTATPEPLQSQMKSLAAASVADYAEHPGLGPALRRAAQRAAKRYAVEDLGVPSNPRHPTVYDFFDDYLRLAYQVQDRSQANAWCGRWWAHEGVLFRVRAMWRSYEYLAVTDPMRADEIFLRTVGDHHMKVLLGPESPMLSCRTHHEPSELLRSDPMENPR